VSGRRESSSSVSGDRPGVTREGQTIAGASLLARYASLVKLPHTLFALPFAGLGAVLASYQSGATASPGTILWIIVAFTAARFAAMSFNRIVDRELDARNPRTRERELPSGRLSVAQAVAAVLAASALFAFAAFRLNALCGWLSPVALGWIFFYSYTKRFTQWSHHVLGLALGIAPVGGFLALSGSWSNPWFALPILAAAVMFWVAGFDVIYSIQDIEFDRNHGLHSIAARQGVRGALLLARSFHAVAAGLFFAIWALELFSTGPLYLAGVFAMIGLLVYENWAVRHAASGGLDLPVVNRAFFQSNVAVSMILFVMTLADRVLAALSAS
jgi:4-hydroxybenzoate polyprenyltransferase